MNAADFPGLFFLDTNIFVYSFDQSAPEKQRVAKQLISEGLRTNRGIISSQVVQEFLSLAVRKFAPPLSLAESREYLRTVLMPLCLHYPSILFYDEALLLREATGFAFYDSLVVAAAIEAGCTTLFTEDLQHGRVIHGTTILNPFVLP